MFKFDIGDTVDVIDTQRGNARMLSMLGKRYTIVEKCKNFGSPIYRLVGCSMWFSEEWLSLVRNFTITDEEFASLLNN